MPLSDIKVKSAKAMNKQYKLTDGGGLYLLVTPSGGKCWRFDYRFAGKRKTLSMGTYPQISLLEARGRLLQAQTDLSHDIDPAHKKKAGKLSRSSNSFESIAFEWHDKFLPAWSKRHADILRTKLKNDVNPWIGSQCIDEITSQDVLRLLRKVEGRGAVDAAHRLRIIIGQVFRYAVATGRADRDVTSDLKGALPPAQKKHMPALTDPQKLADLLRAIDNYKGTFTVKTAMQFQSYTFVRPGELRHAEWTEIDFESCLWIIPAEKMKMRSSLMVPLSRQVLRLLSSIHPLTGNCRYVFPNRIDLLKPLSESGILGAICYMGFKGIMTGHGFRAAARTILDEVLQQRVDLIEHQLAHAVRDSNGRAYNRTAHLDARREMMQLWADYIDGLKTGAQVIPMRRISGE